MTEDPDRPDSADALPVCTDVLVVGAGPAGTATAIPLAHAGWRVTVVDRASFPRPKPCAEYLSPAALRHLADFGVLTSLERSAGRSLTGTTVTGPRGSQLTGLFARTGHHPWRTTGLSLPRHDLDHALVDAARDAGARVCERTAVEDLVYHRGAVAGAVARRGGTRSVVRSRLVIGADGLRSVVARRIGRHHYSHPRRMALVAHVAGVRGCGDTAELHVGPRGYVGLNPLRRGLTNVAVVLPAAVFRAAAGRAEPFLFEALSEFPEVRDRVPRDGVRGDVMVTGPFAAWSRQVVAHGALLVGDAADFFDPFTGEGITAALEGGRMAAGATLAALEEAHPGPIRARALAGYATERRQVFAGKWVVERMIGWGMAAPRLFDRAVERLERRGLAHTLIGVTADLLPARAVLNPGFLARMVL